jgi:hypothetical protein
MRPFELRRSAAAALALLAIASGSLLLGSCSIKRMAARSVANALTTGPDVFARDDDPELVRDAIPFGLKTLESLHEIVPDHRGLLLALCRGFTQYAVGFVQADAERIESTDYAHSQAERGRVLKLLLRARDYGLAGLERDHRGITERLQRDPQSAVTALRSRELPILYWTAAAWGSAISAGKDHPELVADLAAVKALIERGLALDEDYEGGALHEAMIVLEALPPAMGGSPVRAREHFRRAVELSGGRRAGPYVTLAEALSVQTQNRAEFEDLLQRALAVDPNVVPDQRLVNLVLQDRARRLLARADDLFLEAAPATEEEKP